VELNVIAYEFFQLNNIGVWHENAIGMGVPRDEQRIATILRAASIEDRSPATVNPK
jgi:hypothetical protein